MRVNPHGNRYDYFGGCFAGIFIVRRNDVVGYDVGEMVVQSDYDDTRYGV